MPARPARSYAVTAPWSSTTRLPTPALQARHQVGDPLAEPHLGGAHVGAGADQLGVQVPERLGEPLLGGPQPLDLAHRVLEHGLGGQRRQAHETCRVAGGVGDLAVGGAARDADGGGLVHVLLQLDQALLGDHRVVAERHVGVRGAVGDHRGLGGRDLGALLPDLAGDPVDGLARGRSAVVDVVGDVLLGERERHVVGQLRRAEADAHADQPRFRQRRHGGADEHPADDGGLDRRQRRQVGIDQRRLGLERPGRRGRPPAGDPAAHGGRGTHDPAGLRRVGGCAADRSQQLGPVPQRQPVGNAAQQRLRAQQGVWVPYQNSSRYGRVCGSTTSWYWTTLGGTGAM